MGDLTDENVRQLGEKVQRTRNPADLSCVVAILRGQGQGLVQRGTGTLVAIGDKRFMVTASHVVVPKNPDEELELYLVGGLEAGKTVGLRGSRVVSHQPGGLDGDQADVAVWDLHAKTLAGLPDSVFLRQTDIAASDDCGEDYYYFVGFPTEWATIGAEPDSGLTSLLYCTQLYDGLTSAFEKYRPDWHLLLACGGGLSVDTGAATALPSRLHGISGCSIWRTNWTRGGADGQARVVAVQTGIYRSGKVVKATRWEHVMQLIYCNYPHLRPSLSLALPYRRP